ncbi:MAG: sn-glycerol-1-phosphate dehydrogenase [bacterium]
MREVIIEAGAVAQVAGVMRRLRLVGSVFLLADEVTQGVAGERVASILGNAGIKVHAHVLSGRPKAEYSLAEGVAQAVPGNAGAIISCGSGTITDLGKWAAFRRGIPQIAVATAPSMNGYASGIAALTRDGLKSTEPVTPPLAVIADLEVLAAAPIAMIRSGLGDIMSKPVCNADWRLASIVRGERFCIRPFELIRDLEEVYAGQARLIGQRDPRAIAALTEALIYAGISMVIAGSSQPASGGEHLIAHFLDMRAPIEGRAPDFHGAQVGVATIATAQLYERLLATRASDLDAKAIATVWERGDIALARCCELLPQAAGAIRDAFARKRGSRDAAVAEALLIASRWDEIKDAVAPFLKPASELRAILAAAGAKTSYKDLGVSAETFRDALALSFCVRNRFTVLDVAFAAGLLQPWADAVI